MISKIYMIGFGAVATALIEVFNHERKFIKIPFVIIEPKEIHTDVLRERIYIHIKKAISKENIDKLLKDLNSTSLVIDLTVEVDSLMIIKKTIKTGSLYINTSIENWESYNNPNDKMKLKYAEFKKNTLFYRAKKVEKLLKKSKRTRILNCGFNPGAIQEFTKIGLKKYGLTRDKTLVDGNYAKLGHELGLKSIRIVEYDSQTTNLTPTSQLFLNTWSCDGFESEASDFIMLSLNKSDEVKIKQKFDLIKPTDKDDGKTRIRFIPIRGMDMTASDYTLDSNGKVFNYDGGYLVPHAEIISMSKFFQYDGDSPSILYCYRCSDVAIKSLDNMKKNDYKPLEKSYVLENKDIIDGFDSIGSLMTFENGDIFWAGSVLDIETTRDLGFVYGQSTTVQVAGTLYGAIMYMNEFPTQGYLEPEEVPSAFIFKFAKKYYGKCFFRNIKKDINQLSKK